MKKTVFRKLLTDFNNSKTYQASWGNDNLDIEKGLFIVDTDIEKLEITYKLENEEQEHTLSYCDFDEVHITFNKGDYEVELITDNEQGTTHYYIVVHTILID